MTKTDAAPRVAFGMRALREHPLLRGRIAVALLFLLYGVILGSWTARIPAVKQRLGVSDGQLSLALLAFAAGAIVGMQAVGRLVDRYGSRRVMLPAALADGALLLGPAFAPDLPLLVLALFGFGAVHGTLNVAMNANAVEVQRAWGRPIISSFHAVYSIGGFIGSALGGLYARAGLGPAVSFATVTGLVVLGVGWSSRWALSQQAMTALTEAEPVAPQSSQPADSAPSSVRTASSPAPSSSPPPRTRLRTFIAPSSAVLFLGALAFCCLVGEGAAADWSAVYLRDNLHTSAGFAATAYAAFAIAMTAGRLVGDRLTAALGPVRLVRGCGVLASVGLAAGLLVNAPIAGVVGFACLGAGLSCIVPQVFSTAGSRDPARAGEAIARVASLGFIGFVVGPIVIGGVAELVGLPTALAIPVVLVMAVALAAPALRPAAAGTVTLDR
ncbi:MFS transporter [Actinocrinis sp.]|uniref:MFS transporter n=1 Tax=Actinocrinis sp. TaxID=1920516 RepID=UPI002D3E5653|nr:MFS transporter [Actinocrinis sp.]HZP50380.1 MFS transporter [Actinocrinis sp.]